MDPLRTRLWWALCLCQCSPRTGPVIPALPMCDAPPADIAALSVAAPESEVGVVFSSPLSALTQTLERRVPRTLAEGRNQAIGAAGRVTYKIERDALRLSVQPEEVSLFTTLTGTIHVCKPVGPFCVSYGSCRPTWRVQAGLPSDFDRDPRLRAYVDVKLDRGCVLSPVGYDATAELERITRSEARHVRRRIDTELANVQQQLDFAWQQLQEPQHLDADLCLRFVPSAVSYEGPQQSVGGEVTLHISARGKVVTDCASAEQLFTWQPRRQGVPEPQLLLRTSVHWPLADFEAQLAAALGQDIALRVVGPAADAASPAASGTLGPASNRLYVGLPHNAGCRRWLQVKPIVQSSQVRLEALDGEPQEQARLDTAGVDIPPQVALLLQHLARMPTLWDSSREQAQQRGVLVQGATQARVDVVVDAAGLQFWPTLHGSVKVSPEWTRIDSVDLPR